MKAVYLCLVVLAGLVATADGVYFYMRASETRCFYEEIPSETLVVTEYSAAETTLRIGQRIGLRISAKGPGAVSLMEIEDDLTGRFAFHSENGGEHEICVSTNSSASWLGSTPTLQIVWDIRVGDAATDYEAIAKEEHLNELGVSIRKLNDLARTIRRDQTFMKKREEEFRNTSEETNSQVLFWSVAQTIVLVVSSLWQVRYLKSYLIDKKVV